MAYLSLSSVLMQDSGMNFRYNIKPRKFVKRFKNSLLTTSLCPVKDPQPNKSTLPDIIIPERKPIHERTPMAKTKTLPFIKGNPDWEPENKSVISRQDSGVSDSVNFTTLSHTINATKRNKITIKKKLETLLIPKEHKKQLGDIRIEIHACDDLEQKNQVIFQANGGNSYSPKNRMTFMRVNSNLLFLPTEVAPSSTNSSKRSSRKTASPAIFKGLNRADHKDLADDPYFYLNILKFINFSSFHIILDAIVDPISNPFAYYVRIIRTHAKVKPVLKLRCIMNPKAYFECACNFEYTKRLSKPKLLTSSEMKKLIPGLSLLPPAGRSCVDVSWPC